MHCIIHNNRGQNATVNRQLTFDQMNGTSRLCFVHTVQLRIQLFDASDTFHSSQ